MAMDFDAVIDRRGTFSTKWDKYRDTDVLPLWVADMDFRSPEPVVNALRERAEHGVFGYTQVPEPLVQVIVERLAVRYEWHVEPEDIVFLPGVVPGLNMACRALAGQGEAVVTVTPVYYPFLDAPRYAGRELIRVDAELEDSRWRYPLAALEEAASGESRLLMLCNPHNPLGRSLDHDELRDLLDICRRHDLLICSDEIHCDLLFDGKRHVPIGSLDGARDLTVTLMAASKTFNLAGLGGGFAIIQNPDLRRAFVRAGRGILPNVNIFAYTSMLAAYRDCTDWHQALIEYLQANRNFLDEKLAAIPGIAMSPVEATYLAWLDVRSMALEDPVRFFEEAGVGLSGGERFGGPGFVRLNFGCSRLILSEAVKRIGKAAKQLG